MFSVSVQIAEVRKQMTVFGCFFLERMVWAFLESLFLLYALSFLLTSRASVNKKGYHSHQGY